MTIYVGTMGERGSGKSELGRMLREQFGSSPAADLEYSDLMMEAVNQVFEDGYVYPDGFICEMIKAAGRVTHVQLVDRPLRWFRESDRPDVQAALEEWLQGPGKGLTSA